MGLGTHSSRDEKEGKKTWEVGEVCNIDLEKNDMHDSGIQLSAKIRKI